MELVFSGHAIERMRERLIDAAEVAEVLAGAEDRRPSADDPDRMVVIGMTPAGRRLFLVITVGHPTLVVTVAERDAPPRR